MVKTTFLSALLCCALSFSVSTAPRNTQPSPREPEKALSFTEKTKVTAQSFVVTTAHPLATQAGYKILQQGGSAVDAAIAVQMVLNLVEPQSSGIGGGGLMLVHDPLHPTPYYFNGREAAPHKTLAHLFLGSDNMPLSFDVAYSGGISVGVPGLLKMLHAAHAKYGKLPWSQLFKEAIQLARNGFPMTPRLHHLATKSTHLRYTPTPFFDNRGNPWPIGTLLYNTPLANTFELLAKEGITPFYEGALAQKIITAVQTARQHPGFIDTQDLRHYHIREGAARCFPYRNHTICSTGDAISGALTLFEILGILNTFDLRALGKNNPKTYDLIQKAMAIGFADRNLYIADDRFISIPTKGLLSKDYLALRAKEMKQKPALYKTLAGTLDVSISHRATTEKEIVCTTHFSIMDASGLAVSMTSSIEQAFGSGISVEGFLLNNHMTDFSFEPSSNDGRFVANRAEPFKQPRTAMTPVLVYDEKKQLRALLGSAGGPWIIAYVLQSLMNLIDFDMDIQSAISDPHFANLNNGILEIEQDKNLEYLQPFFEDQGIPLRFKRFDGGTHGIEILGPNLLEAGADPRREGVAMGK